MIDLASIGREADALDALCGGDEALFADMMVGETDVDRIILRIHEQIAHDDEMLTGITERQRALAERKKRIESRRDGAKALIGKVLRAGRLPKLELPEVTYSVRDGKPSLEVVDIAAVPAGYLRYKPEPDKAQINADFAEESSLPNWLVWRDARDVVTARTK